MVAIHSLVADDAASLSGRFLMATGAHVACTDRSHRFIQGEPLDELLLIASDSPFVAHDGPPRSFLRSSRPASRTTTSLFETRAVSRGRASRFRRPVGKATGARHPTFFRPRRLAPDRSWFDPIDRTVSKHILD